jgi:hypothetical protein
MNLDLAVARAVAQSHLLESALHSRSTWYIRIGDEQVPATRTVHDRGVSFTACFAEVAETAVQAVLLEGDQERGWRLVDSPGYGFCLTWDLTLEEPVRA